MIYTAAPGHEQPPPSPPRRVLPRPRQPKAPLPAVPKLTPGFGDGGALGYRAGTGLS